MLCFLLAGAAALPPQMAQQMERKGWEHLAESIVADSELIHVVVAVAQSTLSGYLFCLVTYLFRKVRSSLTLLDGAR